MTVQDTASRADLEAALTRLVAELLELDHVDPHGDIFELGADSLSVIRLVARARQALGVALTPGDVFDHPTAASLADFLARTP